ncbi:MAG: NAD(P)H-binding protein [Sphingomonadales bacterium]|nr:NAD(P)H-binding protein [Sphingomonadales bacterium]
METKVRLKGNQRNMTKLPILLVSGASGGLGQLVLQNLLDRYCIDPTRIIAVTRSPAKLSEFAARGIAVRAGDFDKSEGLVEAFSDADRLLLISTDADPLQSYLDDVDPMGDPNRRRVRRQIGAVQAAEAAGVAHIIYTSAPNPEPPTVCFWKRDHFRTEQAIRESSMSWSMLRNWEYPDFHLAYSWAQAVASGHYLAGSGAGRCAFITRKDCAHAAAAALASDFSVLHGRGARADRGDQRSGDRSHACLPCGDAPPSHRTRGGSRTRLHSFSRGNGPWKI